MGDCMSRQKFPDSNRSNENGGDRYINTPMQPPAQMLEPSLENINRIESWPFRDQSLDLQQFSFDDLAKATKNFSNSNILGEGGFGQVYKGVFSPNNMVFAVKKLKHMPDVQRESEFESEIKVVSTVRHENLVKLVGYCSEESDRLLVYEYFRNNSLRSHLHGNDKPTLDWSKRMRIAIGSARGLKHLHEDCSPIIIHRDIKADNILLDDNFEPKVADFGLAKIFPESGSVTHISSSWRGTAVYADPEYYPSQQVCYKSDVYSFGVVLLELISGREPTRQNVQIVDWARDIIQQALRNGDYTSIADPKLQDNYDKSEMERMIRCAEASVYIPSHSRPPMSKIIDALEGTIPLDDIYIYGVDHSEFRIVR